MFTFQRLTIPEVILLKSRPFQDERGHFAETYHQGKFANMGIDLDFVQDNQSFSVVTHTVRGLHLQAPPYEQGKLVRVTRGRIFDVAVDVRTGSPTYSKWVSVELSAENWNQVYIPPGFLHGFMTLEENTEVQYKVTGIYHSESERGVIWNDPDLDIEWPANEAVSMSIKDQGLPLFKDFVSPF